MDQQLQPLQPTELSVDEIKSKLEVGKKGIPLVTVSNFLTVLRNDDRYRGLRMNEMSGRGEVHDASGGTTDYHMWSDSDEASSRAYIEETYRIYNVGKHDDALRILFNERKYNPVKDLIESETWDGEERCEHFLHRWAKVKDNEYSREVSRLIFAGGVHRLYVPGIKFDDVPILIGTKQGEGKSSLVRFLAINDKYYGEVSQMEGQQSIEQLSGKWICEISELLALTKTKDQEAVKAYITRQVDTYRKPYDRQVTDVPRSCVFIGTTNNSNPLSDKSGNRRWYPVYVNSNGYEIGDHEQEIRTYITQCWAEALFKFRNGEMPNYADKKLVEMYREAQEDAMQDDWRVGAITQFLEQKVAGDYTCVREICHRALSANQDFPREPSFQESKDIGMIMNKLPDWESAGRHRIESYGQQRSWRKKEKFKVPEKAEDQDWKNVELPF